MFKRLSQRFGKRKHETERLEEREISISPMLKRLNLGLGKGRQKTRKLWERQFDIVKAGPDEKQEISFVNNLVAEQKASREASAASLRSLLETAVNDAEQIAASIKMKAQTEAEAEATTIINQAEQEAQEIRRRAERAAQKEADAINKYMDLRAVNVTLGEKIAEAEAYVVVEMYGDGYYDYWTDIRLKFGDGSYVDFETYFEEGFEDLVGDINDMIAELNSEYEWDLESIDY